MALGDFYDIFKLMNFKTQAQEPKNPTRIPHMCFMVRDILYTVCADILAISSFRLPEAQAMMVQKICDQSYQIRY